MSDSSAISPDEASRIIKEHASKQQIRVEIIEDQLQAMLSCGWTKAQALRPRSRSS
jgi:hypothetical protein